MLDRVTITGADDSVFPHKLAELSAEFPFVEWALLFSPKHEGSPRWPSCDWVAHLRQGIRNGAMNLSAHLCGGYVRDLLAGDFSFAPEGFSQFQRVQLNFHAQPQETILPRLVKALDRSASGVIRQFIFQIDGVNDWIFEEARDESNLDLVPLFDGSHGAGVVPSEWPKAEYINMTPGEHGEGIEIPIYHGYAGGLGPDTLETELPKIFEAAGDARIWIDMETRVRSDNDRLFDLAKVRRCLEICAPFIGQPVPQPSA